MPPRSRRRMQRARLHIPLRKREGEGGAMELRAGILTAQKIDMLVTMNDHRSTLSHRAEGWAQGALMNQEFFDHGV